MITGVTLTKDNAIGTFVSSFEDKYIITDNLDGNNTFVQARERIYNNKYIYVIIVTRGTLNVNVGGIDVEIKANEMLAIMPCVSIEFKDSHCQFFSFMTRSHIMADIYEHTHIGTNVTIRAFCYRYHVLDKEKTEMFLKDYLLVKREHMRPNYQMKELVLRALQTAYVSHFFSFVDENSYILEQKDSRQYSFFNKFLEELSLHHKKERSVQFYANQLRITPKYLSSITQAFTGLSAFQVIDQYVIFAIKQTLYSNKSNIKTISTQFNFPSQSFFGRYFKRITGTSPNEYIKNHNRKALSFQTIK